MKKEDQYLLTKEAIINSKFESTKYDSLAKQSPLHAKQAAANELIKLKNQHHERIQTAKKHSEEAQRAEIENTKRELKEAQEKLAELQNSRPRTHETRTHDS